MKRILLCAASLVLITVSCKKILNETFTGFDANVPDFQVTVPAIPVVPSGEISLGSFTTSFNLDSTIRVNTGNIFSLSDVSSITVRQVVVNLPNGDASNNLSNFTSTRVTLASNTDTIPANFINLSFPDTATQTVTNVPASSPELIGYLKGNQLTYHIYGQMRRPTSKALNMAVSVTFHFK